MDIGLGLSAAVKHRLPDLFVLGVPCYRQQFGDQASTLLANAFTACCVPVALKSNRSESHSKALSNVMKPPLAEPERANRANVAGVQHKIIVFRLIKCNGCIKAMPIPAHDRASVMQQIQAHIHEGALYYIDEWQAYATLRLRGEHVMIRKARGRPVGHEHTQWH